MIADIEWDGPVLVVPGLGGSNDEHWQTLWEDRFPYFFRVEQADWRTPDLDRWARTIIDAAIGLEEPALIIAHSFGCLAALRAAQFQSDLIAGALLVAPADPDRFDVGSRISASPLLFPTALIASRNDPWLSFDRAREWADRWGSEFVDVGHAGHINADSGLGAWSAGLRQLRWLCRRMSTSFAALPVAGYARPEYAGGVAFAI